MQIKDILRNLRPLKYVKVFTTSIEEKVASSTNVTVVYRLPSKGKLPFSYRLETIKIYCFPIKFHGSLGFGPRVRSPALVLFYWEKRE